MAGTKAPLSSYISNLKAYVVPAATQKKWRECEKEETRGRWLKHFILVSGYLEGGERLEKRAAVVEYSVGQGRVILIGFRAQHRAQPVRTFKLLFNTLYSLE